MINKAGEKGNLKLKKDGFISRMQQAFLIEEPNVNWFDIAGLEQAKEFFKEALTLPYQFPQLFTGKRKPSNAILLNGVSSITI